MDAELIDACAGDPRDSLPDLDKSLLVVQRQHLGTRENFKAAGFLKGPQQEAYVLAASREDQPPETKLIIGSPYREIRQPLAADGPRILKRFG